MDCIPNEVASKCVAVGEPYCPSTELRIALWRHHRVCRGSVAQCHARGGRSTHHPDGARRTARFESTERVVSQSDGEEPGGLLRSCQINLFAVLGNSNWPTQFVLDSESKSVRCVWFAVNEVCHAWRLRRHRKNAKYGQASPCLRLNHHRDNHGSPSMLCVHP
ncbi:MAG: hypothetical protein RL187_75, partial [Actinomycetota bacterium]